MTLEKSFHSYLFPLFPNCRCFHNPMFFFFINDRKQIGGTELSGFRMKIGEVALFGTKVLTDVIVSLLNLSPNQSAT